MQDKRSLYLALGREFVLREGRAPARSDFRGQRREEFIAKHGIEYPTARQVEYVFGTWGNFVELLGAKRSYRNQEVGRIAARFLADRFGIEDVNHHIGAVDGYLNGQPVEIKAAELSQDFRFGHVRWRFRLHRRKYSLLVDYMFLVGLYDSRPIIVWKLNKSDIVRFADNRDSFSQAAAPPLLGRWYPLAPNEIYKEQFTYDEILTILRGMTKVPAWEEVYSEA